MYNQKINEIGSWNPETKSYSGAIGEILSKVRISFGQKIITSNFSLVFQSIDSYTASLFFPIHDEMELVDYTHPLVEDEMKITSSYHVAKSVERHDKDILFMFKPIPSILWLELILSFFAFIILFKICHQLLDPMKRSETIWIITCAFLGQGEFPPS